MKCEACVQEWEIPDLGERMVKFCPFCGAEYKEKEPEGFASMADCFRYLKRRYTHTIFFEEKKMVSCVSDYMPQVTVEKRILKTALEANVYKLLLDDSGNIITLNIDKAKHKLVDDFGLSEKWAGEAVDWLVRAYGTAQNQVTAPKLAAEEKKNNPAPVKPMVKKVVGQDHKGYYTYMGEVDGNQIPNGAGELIYASGERYIGTFVNGFLSGKGTWILKEGKTFEGWFQNGKQAEGSGILTEKNGDVWKGYFRKGLRMHGLMEFTARGRKKPVRVFYDNGHEIYTVK